MVRRGRLVAALSRAVGQCETAQSKHVPGTSSAYALRHHRNAKGNFAPGPDSPALGSGTQVRAPADDFFGNPRKAGAIDRGAVQVTR